MSRPYNAYDMPETAPCIECNTPTQWAVRGRCTACAKAKHEGPPKKTQKAAPHRDDFGDDK